MCGPGHYFETIVWQWDSETKKRGEITFTADSGWSKLKAYYDHAQVVAKLIAGESLEEQSK